MSPKKVNIREKLLVLIAAFNTGKRDAIISGHFTNPYQDKFQTLAYVHGYLKGTKIRKESRKRGLNAKNKKSN